MNCTKCRKRLPSTEKFIDHVKSEHQMTISQSPIESPLFDTSQNIRKSLSKSKIVTKGPNKSGD